MRCIFGEDECNKSSCWGCEKVPDLNEIKVGVNVGDDLEYKLLSAVGEHKRRKWKDREVHWSECPSWMSDVSIDHTKCFKDSGGEIFVRTEPYDIGLESIEHLVETFKEKGLSCQISGNGVHFPGKTFVIDVKKKKM